MACDDLTSAIHVRVDLDDRLLDWDYYKVACGREINADGRLKAFCLDRPIADVVSLTLDDVSRALSIADEEERFLLFLELDALQNAAAHYLGRTTISSSGRYQMAAIAYDTDYVEIRQTIMPAGQTAAPAPGADCTPAGCGDCPGCGI